MLRVLYAALAACGVALLPTADPGRAEPRKGPGFCVSAANADKAAPDKTRPADKKTDWPMFGGTPARNMINLSDKNIPTDWCVDKAKPKHIKWTAALGTRTFGGPVVAGGKVFVGTNNGNPRDSSIRSKASRPGNNCVLMCFRESDGMFLWQAVHDVPNEESFHGVRDNGLMSTPSVAGDRVYYVLPHAVAICVDAVGGKILWQYDMRKELKVAPYSGFCRCRTGNSSPLVVGDLVYLATGNGIDDTGKLPHPQAPSFVALDKNTGKLVWQSNLPGDKVVDGQWSNPAYAVIKGKPQVIFAGGDATIYSFEPQTGKVIWKFHCYPDGPKDGLHVDKGSKRTGRIDSYFVATPVIHDDKIYIGLGVDIDHQGAPNHAYFLCIDATRTGDVSPGTLVPGAAGNKNSALLWSYGGAVEPAPKKGRPVFFGPTVSGCVVHDGLVYIPELHGYMHCLDARTGDSQWVYDFYAQITGSPYFVDGKVYVASDDGDIVVFQAGKQLKIINKIDMQDAIPRTPVAANGVLFLATDEHLYAIAEK